MVPGTQSVRIPNLDGLLLRKRRHRIDDERVGREVAAANDIAGPSACQLYSVLIELLLREEGLTIRVNNELGRALARTVWILFAHRIAFAITPHLFAVLVALVAGDRQHSAGPRKFAHTF